MSSPSVAGFCMKKTADDNETQFSDSAISALKRSFYVDDMLKSVASVAEGVQLHQEMTELLKRGGFRLTKWLSTHCDVLADIPEAERAKSLQAIDLNDSSLPNQSALGLKWNVELDAFIYDVDLPDKPITKRGLLSMTSSLYDPLGFVGPVVLVPKLIQQELCRQQLDWDDKIPDPLADEFVEWLQEVGALTKLKIERCLKPCTNFKDEPQIELHTFSDASEFAYGAAVYAKVITDCKTRVALVIGKSRVAPLKVMSIPRLKLTAAVVAAKLHKFVFDEMVQKPAAAYFWTDSMTVLGYLSNTATRFKTFVAHRVDIIQHLTKGCEWNYVPSAVNPADLASRGVKPQETKKLEVWLNGPDFLRESEDYTDKFIAPKEELELELKTTAAATAVTPTEVLLSRYSSYHRLCRGVAWLHKIGAILLLKPFSKGLRDKDVACDVPFQLSVADVQAAEKAVIRYIQQLEFGQEVKKVLRGETLPRGCPLIGLDPQVNKDGLLRVGGRLANTTADVDIHPIVLPKHPVTELMIREIHEQNAHAGANHTLSLVKRRFFPLNGYGLVRQVLGRCVLCKKRQGHTQDQKMADLPKARVEVDLPPFTNTGIDYFGPISVKYRRGTVKRWGCLVTCMVTRAVHIEVAHYMTADSFLMAFHRFVARREKPSVVYSDKGSNFTAAEKELREEVEAINTERVEQDMLLEAIEWHFIPPYAPHMGGVWERLVRSVKTTLQALVTDRLLTDEELLSYLAEVEKVLNDRPLTKMGSDPKDEVPITPSDLLLLRGNSSSSAIASDNPLRKRWATVQDLANRFYERFTREYLPTLQGRQKWVKERPPLRVGDIVLVMDDDAKRGRWPLGLVVETVVSQDGIIRSVKVKTGDNIKLRPADRLVFLEHHE